MTAPRSCAALVAAVLAAGCAQTPGPLPVTEAESFGALDAVYDRTKWRWVRNRDGRALLTHAEAPQCFLDPNPPYDHSGPGITVRREQKMLGGTRYDVVKVFQDRQFFEAVYVRGQDPLLSVYSDDRCRDEAERILVRYEQTLRK